MRRQCVAIHAGTFMLAFDELAIFVTLSQGWYRKIKLWNSM
jgi:hypothetical protein